jgi:hypothetical protein
MTGVSQIDAGQQSVEMQFKIVELQEKEAKQGLTPKEKEKLARLKKQAGMV